MLYLKRGQMSLALYIVADCIQEYKKTITIFTVCKQLKKVCEIIVDREAAGW